jgi:hypothetical protein
MRLFAAPPAVRHVIVVRRDAEDLFHYLSRALARVRDVEVTLDRRSTSFSVEADRRRPGVQVFNAVGVLIARR